MTMKIARSGLVVLLVGAAISTFVFYWVHWHFYLRGPDLLIITGVPGATLVKMFFPHALEVSRSADMTDHNILYRIIFHCEDRHRLYMLCAWIQLSLYSGLIANQLVTRLSVRRQAALTANETIPGAWMRQNAGSPAREESNQSSQTTHRALKLAGGLLMTSIGVGLLYVASLFGLNGGEFAGVPALIFIWIGLFFFLAKKGWALALLSVASILMLGFVVLGWMGIRTALFLRFS